MEGKMAAIEMMGIFDEHRQLRLDGDLPVPGPLRVRVLVLFASDDEWNEAEWLHAAARNPAFASLAESKEDIYTLSDGKAFDGEA